MYLRILLVVSLAFVATGLAYAEKTEIDVPFDWDKHGCTLFMHENRVLYQCYFAGEFDTFVEPDTPVFPETDFDVIKRNDTVIDKPIPEIPEVPKTPQEKLIEQLQEDKDNGTISSADAELLNILKELNECYRGLGASDPIQTDGSWEVPEEEPYTLFKAYSYKTNKLLGEMVAAYQECLAQKTLEDKVTGQQYIDIANANVDDGQIYHGDNHIATSKDSIPYPSSEHTPYLLEAGNERARLTICLSDVYPEQFKKQQGCQITYQSGEAAQLSTKELTDIQKARQESAGALCDADFPTGYKRDMGCQMPTEPTPEIPRNNINPADSEILKKFLEYKETHVTDIPEAKEKSKQKALNLTIKSFAQQFGLDEQDIRDLIQRKGQ